LDLERENHTIVAQVDHSQGLRNSKKIAKQSSAATNARLVSLKDQVKTEEPASAVRDAGTLSHELVHPMANARVMWRSSSFGPVWFACSYLVPAVAEAM
jgi:hypothetical protein